MTEFIYLVSENGQLTPMRESAYRLEEDLQGLDPDRPGAAEHCDASLHGAARCPGGSLATAT